MSDSDRLEDDRDVDGVRRWSQSGQYILNGLDAAEGSRMRDPKEKEVWECLDSPGAVEVGDEDGGFHRRFRGTDAHIDT